MADAQINGDLPKSGTFEAGRLDEVKMISSNENIDDYDFWRGLGKS